MPIGRLQAPHPLLFMRCQPLADAHQPALACHQRRRQQRRADLRRQPGKAHPDLFLRAQLAAPLAGGALQPHQPGAGQRFDAVEVMHPAGQPWVDAARVGARKSTPETTSGFTRRRAGRAASR